MDFDGGIPPPRLGESPPYVRFVESPRTVILAAEPQAIRKAETFADELGVACTNSEVLQAGLVTYIIFGEPVSNRCAAESFKPLKGRYVSETEVVGDPRDLPTFPLLILFVFVLGRSLFNIILVLVLFGWADITIIVRSMVLSVKSNQFVEAAKLAGASSWWIMRRHILPPCSPTPSR